MGGGIPFCRAMRMRVGVATTKLRAKRGEVECEGEVGLLSNIAECNNWLQPAGYLLHSQKITVQKSSQPLKKFVTNKKGFKKV